MTWKSILNVVAAIAMSATFANAQTVGVSGVVNGGNIDWTVMFTPATPMTSLGIEFTLETDADILAAPTIISTDEFQENISGTDIINPGIEPFGGTEIQGIFFAEGVGSVVSGGPGGTVDGFFAPLGSTDFSGAGPFDFMALAFTTAGTSETNVWFNSVIAQGGVITVNNVAGMATAGGMVVPGDANGDGQVDPADAAILGANWLMNVGGGASDGDFNGDGLVDPADAAILGGNWLFGVPGSVTSVPEPSAIALLMLTLSGCAFRRNR